MADLTKATRGHRGSPWPAGPVASIGIAEGSVGHQAGIVECQHEHVPGGSSTRPAHSRTFTQPTSDATLAGIVAAALPYAPALTP